MIAVNHPGVGAMRSSGPFSPHILPPAPIPKPIVHMPAPTPEPVPVNPIRTFAPAEPASPVVESGVQSLPSSSSESSGSSSSGTSGSLPVQVSNIIDPVTGVTYAGYLTQDAQTLYQSGSLLTGGNELTPQGSALAAQGDLIQGTAAPSATQIAQAQPALSTGTDFFSSAETWLGEETVISGYPNGLVATVGVIAIAWLFGGKKRRR
jgi:hypothetical protein